MSNELWNLPKITSLLMQAGGLAMTYFRTAKVEMKEDLSLVTEADLAVESMLRKELDRPDLGWHFIGEESVESKGEDYLLEAMKGTAFVVDPIDGTMNYANGSEMWGVSIGLMVEGKLVEGAMYLPALRELYISHGDRVLFQEMNGQTVLAERFLSTPKPLPVEKGILSITQNMAKKETFRSCSGIHCTGCAIYSIRSVLLGNYLGYIGRLKLWDVAGGLPLVHRLGLDVSLRNGRSVGLEVREEIFETPSFAMTDNVIICPANERETILSLIGPR